MSPSKIVVCVSGSIAAYKSCELVSLLVKRGHQVRVLMTESAQKFVGPVTLQALSGQPVVVADQSSENYLTHIELGTWCDIAILYPASAQSLNSLSLGVGNGILTSFFLAYDLRKPFLVAPAMNTRMLQHPTTQESLRRLAQMGLGILASPSGQLACGETGQGRLIEPELAVESLERSLPKLHARAKKILITAGGTRETIDGVRTLTNLSTGGTGAALADHFHAMGHQVLLLTNASSVRPSTPVRIDTYQSFQDIWQKLRALGQSQEFDLILHAAAISDYSIAKIHTPEGEFKPGQGKMSSQFESVSLELKRNEKILPRLKDLFKVKPIVVGFKLTSTDSQEEQARAIFSLFQQNAVDYVVHNDVGDIQKGERRFLMTSDRGAQERLQSVQELARAVDRLLHNKQEVTHDPVP